MAVGSTCAIFIIARLSSQRVPGKNLISLDGVPMIARLYDRLSKSELVDRVIVCTSTERSDDPLVEYCENNGMLVGRGPLDDVMARINRVARDFGVATIVEVLGDNPFVTGGLIDHAVKLYQEGGYDYVANYSNDYMHELDLKKFPIGVRVQVYGSRAAELYDSANLVTLSHPCSYLYSNPSRFKAGFFGAEAAFSGCSAYDWLNLSVNYPKNVALANRIFEELGNDADVPEILALLSDDSGLMALAEQEM